MLTQLAKGASSIDGKLLRSCRLLLFAPGALTKLYVSGARRRFVSPLALFFVANALFVGIQALVGVNILSTPLDAHLETQDWSGLARQLVQARLQASSQDYGSYAPHFDQAAIFNAKALMILMVLAFAPIAAALFSAKRTTIGMHIIFALHLYAFIITLLCFAVLLAGIEGAAGGGGLRSRTVDVTLSLLNLVAAGIYIYLAIGCAYGASGTTRILKAVLLTACVAILFLGYRFLIFLITLYTA